MAFAVQFEDVSFRVGDRTILSRLNLAVAEGEALVLLGRSGSGKTTTLKLVNRLLEPSRGRVWVQGREAQAWDAIELRRRVGYVIQEIGLFPHFSVEQNVGLVPSLERWKPLRIKTRVWELLQLVGLEPEVYAKRYPQQLSGGQRQRVGVARALAADPPILLLDEPFGALDPITRLELQQEFHRLRTKLNKTAIFVTHDIGEAFRLGTRIGLMYEGELVMLGTPQEFRQATHPEARRFLQCLQVGLSLEEA